MILLEVITDIRAKSIVKNVHCQNKKSLIHVKVTGFFQVLSKPV
jgi:hypothetical protein